MDQKETLEIIKTLIDSNLKLIERIEELEEKLKRLEDDVAHLYAEVSLRKFGNKEPYEYKDGRDIWPWINRPKIIWCDRYIYDEDELK